MPDAAINPEHEKLAGTRLPAASVQRVSIRALGMGLGSFLTITYVLCVIFDLWVPDYAMYEAWQKFLPGFTWLTWPSFFLGLIETFAYGWYVALVFAPLYNFFALKIR